MIPRQRIPAETLPVSGMESSVSANHTESCGPRVRNRAIQQRLTRQLQRTHHRNAWRLTFWWPAKAYEDDSRKRLVRVGGFWRSYYSRDAQASAKSFSCITKPARPPHSQFASRLRL